MSGTKAEFMRECANRGIEIDDDEKISRDRQGRILPRNIHAYTPAGYKFKNVDLHNQSLGSFDQGEPINWSQLMADVELVPCEDRNCDYCQEEEEI